MSNRKSMLFRGLAALFAFLFLLILAASTLMFQFAGVISGVLNVPTSKVIELGENEPGETVYFTSEFGDDYSNKQSAMELELAVAAENITQAEEGAVLVRNENSALPLAADSKITLFGNGSYNTSLGDTQTSSVDYIPTMTVSAAFQKVFGEGNVNTTLLDNVYSKMSMSTNLLVSEASISEIRTYENTWANDFNDAAVVVITRLGGESNDSLLYAEDGGHFLSLQQNERDLLSYLKDQKAAGTFGKIVALINSDQMVELGWLEDYEVDACIVMGLPGVTGMEGVANLVAGNVSPSGKLVDTYAYNSLSSPAMTYANGNMQTWGNVDEVNAKSADTNVTGENIDYYTIYAEGIYVGYKYYETRYEDSVLGTGHADSTVGSTSGSAWKYSDEVMYTFGYGLSYSQFDQELKDVRYDEGTDQYIATVGVTNTGDVAAKSVVELYAQTPYGDYEKTNGIEKSAIQLVGFAKTDTLAPGESVDVTVEADRYLLASYDSTGAKGYILSQGEYYLAIGDDAHDALNNILAAKGYSQENGMTANGNSEKTYSWVQADMDQESYRLSQMTGAEVTNQFDFGDPSYYGIDFTYLSRDNWEDTYPAQAVSINATDQMIKDIDSTWYEKSDDAPAVSDFVQGASNGLKFVDMRNVDWEDEETWNSFIDQLTVDEMAEMMNDARGTKSVDSIALPGFRRADDNMMVDSPLISTAVTGLGWASEVMTSRTWNQDLATRRGHLIGVECAFAGVNELWYGGGNIHRTPFSGRNRQYYSEDGNFGYIMGALEAKAMQETGTNYCIKHFALNDQEDGREGISTFASEQAIRENYLRAFEGALTKGGALGVMASFNRIGCIQSYVNSALLQTVLRDEWGFKGHVTTDGFSLTPYKTHYLEMFVSGIDYSCLDPSNTSEAVKAAINEGDGFILQRLREATKANVYAASRTTTLNGLSSNTKVVSIVPAWETALLVSAAIFGVCFVTFTVLYICTSRSNKKGTIKEEG